MLYQKLFTTGIIGSSGFPVFLQKRHRTADKNRLVNQREFYFTSNLNLSLGSLTRTKFKKTNKKLHFLLAPSTHTYLFIYLSHLRLKTYECYSVGSLCSKTNTFTVGDPF